MDAGHPQLGEHLLLEHLGVGGGGLAVVGDGVVFLHHGADDIGLPSGGDLFVDELIDPLVVGPGDGIGLYRLPPWGQLVDNGHIQVPIDKQGQGPGDGRGAHDQQVGGGPLLGQSGPLVHAKAVLLVRDDQPQVPEGDLLADQGVGADGQVHLSGGDGRLHGPVLLGGEASRQQGAAQPGGLQQRGEGLVVLGR